MQELPGAADQLRGDMIYSYGFSIVHTKEVWRETPYPAVSRHLPPRVTPLACGWSLWLQGV